MESILHTSTTWDLASSPFASVVGKNYIPGFAELSRLKAAVVEPQYALHSLELEEKRLETYIDAHQALLSSIRRIPSEALAEIFIWCLPSESAYGLRSTVYAPLLMTRVCRHWRRTAIDTPRLWKSLHIHFPPHLSEEAASRRIAGIVLWLMRSGTLPISLSLHGSTICHTRVEGNIVNATDPERSAQANMTLLMNAMLQFCGRIQDIHLSLAQGDFTSLKDLVLASNLSFPNLTSSKVEDYRSLAKHGGEINNDDPLTYSPLLPLMPALRRLYSIMKV